MKINFLTICLLFCIISASGQTVVSKLINDERSFEVTAVIPSENKIIVAWMERRPNRKNDDESAKDTRVAYKFSNNNGQTWTEKGIIDLPNTFGTGNPYLTSNKKGETFLTVMHIGNNFYEGNISVYRFDFEKKQFDLKSIPFESKNTLLDKPAMAVFGNEMHIVYVAYPQGKKNSLKYQISKDYGKSWSKPFTIELEKNVSVLGPSIALLKGNQVAISCGSYGSENIYFIKKKAHPSIITFEKPIIIGKVGAGNQGAAMSELICYNNCAAVTWQSPHQPNEVWMSSSTDRGNTWSTPLLVTSKGNLLSVAFDDKEILHSLYSDFNAKQFSVVYKSFKPDNTVLALKIIKGYSEFSNQNEYIGAFQKLLLYKSNNYGFWIDYTNNSGLMFSTWKS